MSATSPPATTRVRTDPPPEIHRELETMSAAHRYSNLAGVVLPMVGLVAAIVLLWGEWVDWSALAALAVMYAITGLGVALGLHRLLTHPSFQTFKVVQFLLPIPGSMSVQGPVM